MRMTAFASLVLQFGWFIFWSVAIFLVQQYTTYLAYFLTIYLIFSYYWVSQGTMTPLLEASSGD